MCSLLLFAIGQAILVHQTIGENMNHDLEMYGEIDQVKDYYELPKLPFKYDAMEPWIDAKTMEAHYTGIHSAYAAKMNAVLQEWRKSGEDKELAHSSLLNIMQNVRKVPEKWRESVRNHAGGYVNHLYYFATMQVDPKNETQGMPRMLRSQFFRSFPHFSEFKDWMDREALAMHGSGYVWLCREPKQNYLTVYPTHQEHSPLSSGLQPLLVIDLWEHAYYIKHQSERKDYVKNWWKTVSWEKVDKILQWWKKFDPRHDEL